MYIKRAAILYETGELFEGTVYLDISRLAKKLGVEGDCIHGFIDSTDSFVDRAEAAKIAKKAGQVPEDYNEQLYPEDIFGGTEYAID